MVKGLRKNVACIPCAVCGKEFYAWSLAGKYCPECRLVMMRYQQTLKYYESYPNHVKDISENKWFKRLAERRSLNGSL